MRHRTAGLTRPLPSDSSSSEISSLRFASNRRPGATPATPATPWRDAIGCACLLAAILAAGSARVAAMDGGAAGERAAGVPAHLTIASEGARPPYNYLDGDRLAGFEIDLARDLCRRMATECTFVAEDWDSLIPSLLAHRSDAIMAAMEITRARQGLISFTAPYVRMPSAFLVRKNTDLAGAMPGDLAGRVIGVERGGTHQTYLQQIYPRSVLHAYGSLGDAILDLEAGRVDAAIGDKDAIADFLAHRRDSSCCRILGDVARDPAIFGDGIAIGVRKEDGGLRAAFEAALADAKADGTFAAISGRYFSFPIN